MTTIMEMFLLWALECRWDALEFIQEAYACYPAYVEMCTTDGRGRNECHMSEVEVCNFRGLPASTVPDNPMVARLCLE